MQRVKSILPFVFVVILYAGLRLAFLDHMAHGDERHWVGRSLNFYRALITGEFQFTFQKEHPGVMTMWAGTLGYIFRFPGITDHMSGNNSDPQTSILQMWNWGLQAPEVLVALRASKVLLQTVFFAISLRYLMPLVGKGATLLFGTLLAVSPTLLGWDSWLHIDGLSAIATLAAISTVAFAAEQTRFYDTLAPRTRWLWIIGGVLCATSWLNRITGVSLVVVVAMVILIQLVSQRKEIATNSMSGRDVIQSCLRAGGFWLVGALTATFAILPALWVNPIETIKAIVWLPISGALRDGPNNFFPDSLVDPGWLYYPQEILIRTTYFEWLGIIAVLLLSYVAWKKNLVPRSAIRLLPMLIVFAAIYVLGLSLSPKKASQYMANIYPLITLASSLGLMMIVGWFSQCRFNVVKWSSYILISSAVLYSAVAAGYSLPYKTAYNNPAGLELTARTYNHSIRPGYPQIADFLSGLDTGSPMKVGFSSGGFKIILGYLLPPSFDIQLFGWGKITSPSAWYEMDYQILGVDYPVDQPMYRYGVDPIFRIESQGRVLWEIYPGSVTTPYRTALVPTECTTTFGEHVTLYQIVASNSGTDFYFLSENGRPVIVEAYIDGISAVYPIGVSEVNPIKDGVLVKVSMDGLESDPYEERAPVQVDIYVYDAETGVTLETKSLVGANENDHATLKSDCFSRPLNKD